MGILKYSTQESKITGVRVARSERIVHFHERDLLSEILEGQYDFCKLKVSANDDEILLKLRSLNIPLSIYSILVRNNKRITSDDLNYIPRSGLEFRPYDGSNAIEFEQLVKEIVANPTAINYTNPEFQEVVSDDKFLEASTKYSLRFNQKNDFKKWAWLLNYNNENVGFVLGEFDDDSFEGILHGVRPKFRGQHFGADIMSFLNKTCAERGIKHFRNDVVVQNLASLTNIVQAKIFPVEFFFNVTINSFLSFSQKPIETLDSKNNKHTCLEQFLIAHLSSNHFYLAEFQNVKIEPLPSSGKCKLEISYPIFNDNKFLAVTKVYDKSDRICSLFYALFKSN